MDQQQTGHPLTDFLAIGRVVLSATGFAVSLSATQQIVSIFAGLVSIVAGCFAIRYYIKKTKS